MATKKSSSKGKKPRTASLKAGRPPTAAKPKASVSAKTTRTVINKLHQINKQLVKAKAAGDDAAVSDFEKQIDALGGLPMYQLASIQGQSIERGGDSSIVLMQWLEEAGLVEPFKSAATKLNMLEVGALSTKNACATSGVFKVQHIDLHSQAEGILQQDFMDRPVPTQSKDRFDIISLSLVLNFVPDAAGRGEMLRRTCAFLEPSQQDTLAPQNMRDMYPALFLVLPGSCVANSRYMDEERLNQLMASLGYVQTRRKQTEKLVYYLWHMKNEPAPQEFPKKEVNPGVKRNNFAIILK